MIALFLTRDLMFQPKVAAAAQRNGFQVFAGGSIATLTTRTEQYAEAKLLIVDLSISGLDVLATVQEARSLLPNAKILAYGPHVHVDQLTSARQAGCDAVLTRGQFEANMNALFEQAV